MTVSSISEKLLTGLFAGGLLPLSPCDEKFEICTGICLRSKLNFFSFSALL